MPHYRQSAMLISVLTLNALFVSACTTTAPESAHSASVTSKMTQKPSKNQSSTSATTQKTIEIEMVSERQLMDVPYKTIDNKARKPIFSMKGIYVKFSKTFGLG